LPYAIQSLSAPWGWLRWGCSVLLGVRTVTPQPELLQQPDAKPLLRTRERQMRNVFRLSLMISDSVPLALVVLDVVPNTHVDGERRRKAGNFPVQDRDLEGARIGQPRLDDLSGHDDG